jgi:hypothetical protein
MPFAVFAIDVPNERQRKLVPKYASIVSRVRTMFMIPPARVGNVRQNPKRAVKFYPQDSPTAILDQLTPFWPGSFAATMIHNDNKQAGSVQSQGRDVGRKEEVRGTLG